MATRSRGPTGRTSAAAATAAAARPVSWASDVATHLIATTAQLLNAATTWKRSGGSLLLRACPGLIFLLDAVGLLVLLCAPRFHMRHRTAVFAALRVGAFLLPSTRDPSVGTALVLHRAAQPGARGAAQDLLRALTGNRTLPLLVVSNFAMLPPVATLFMSAALTALQWNSAGYCATPLLSDPLSQRRQAALAAALEYASVPLVAAQPRGGQLVTAAVLAGEADPEAVCRATHSFLHVCCGLLAPVFLSAWRWPAPVQPRSAAAAAASSGGVREKWHSSLPAARQRAAAAMHAQLRLVAGVKAAPTLRALVVWWLLANTWIACKTAAGL